jgi:hypothetical protein
MLRALRKLLLGYDVFISYAFAGGRRYAHALERQLTGLDFACFIDSEELPLGEGLRPSLARAIRRSRVLLLVGTRNALTAPYVDVELGAALALRRAVIPIDVDGIRKTERWPELVDVPWLEEPLQGATEPSERVLADVRRHFAFTRRNAIARRLVGTAAFVFFCVAAFATVQWRNAEAERVRALARQLTAQSELVRALSPQSLPVSLVLAAESVRQFSSRTARRR